MDSHDITQVERFLSRLGNFPAGLPEFAKAALTDRTIVLEQPESTRLFIFSSSKPTGRSTFFASSRLGRALERFPSWFDAVRTAASQLVRNSDFLVSAKSITAERFIKRAGELWGLPVVDFRPLPSILTDNWFEEIEREPNVAYYSGSLPKDSNSVANDASPDAVLTEFADNMIVLRVTHGGNIFHAAKNRLLSNRVVANQETAPNPRVTRILLDSELTKPAVAEELIEQGAAAWWLYPAKQTSAPESGSNPFGEQFQAPIQALHSIDPSEFLTHWTRTRAGPWPDQTEADFIDDLLFGCEQSQHNSFAALCRIMASSNLIASNQITRSDQPVICWTEVPLGEYADRRTFRSHLGRWDFEPFGIGINIVRLLEFGARQVIYGTEAIWNSLGFEDQPYFQPERSKNNNIDWRLEQEWRTPGDLDLRKLSTDDAFVFVLNQTYAEKIRPLSRWPVVVLE